MQDNKDDRKNTKSYREVLGKVEGLQRGFTTGTCAQAASKAAAIMLCEQKIIKEVEIELKGSVKLTLPVVNPVLYKNFAECGIIKDSGDDDDITHGHEFRSKVTYIDNKGIEITGGRGVGKVTKEGLPVKVGEWAINNNPRKMIIKSLTPLMPEGRGFLVEISVPDGEELAGKTWNPRLGIKGGISIIGTSGIVEPKSSKAYTASIAISMNVVRKQDSSVVYIVFGYVGESFVKKKYGVEDEKIIKVGDHAGFAVKKAAKMNFDKIVLAGHIGKMAKIAAGIFNTHSKYGDARLETIAAYAGAAGMESENIKKILNMKMAEHAAKFLVEQNHTDAFDLMNRALVNRLHLLSGRKIHVDSVILDLEGNILSEYSYNE